jgi:hypothetical protein
VIIGLSGSAGAGKSTLAQAICDTSGMGFNPVYTRRCFAALLKLFCSLLTGTHLGDQRYNKGKYLNDWGMTIGQMQQKLGTDAVRNNLHPDAWVIALMSQYHPQDYWVIDDVRFPNEAQAIRDRGGILVRIVRPSTVEGGRDHGHESETALDTWTDWDLMIHSNSDEAHLAACAVDVLRLAFEKEVANERI